MPTPKKPKIASPKTAKLFALFDAMRTDERRFIVDDPAAEVLDAHMRLWDIICFHDAEHETTTDILIKVLPLAVDEKAIVSRVGWIVKRIA